MSIEVEDFALSDAEAEALLAKAQRSNPRPQVHHYEPTTARLLRAGIDELTLAIARHRREGKSARWMCGQGFEAHFVWTAEYHERHAEVLVVMREALTREMKRRGIAMKRESRDTRPHSGLPTAFD